MAKLLATQLEQLRDIGAYLRQARQAQSRTIDDIASQIFIRPALLRALEEGEGDQLPEPVFVQGFIRRYGEALGLDGNALSKEFSVMPAAVLPESLVTDAVHSAATLESAATPRPPRKPRSDLDSGSDSPGGSFPWNWVAGLLAIALGAGLGIWGLKSLTNRSTAPTSAASSNAPAATTPSAIAEPTPLATPTIEPSPTPSLAAPVVVSVELSDRAWISVEIDGETVYEGTLESGTTETWTGQSNITLTTGNAGGVALSFNGNDPVVLGEVGVVETVTLTPNTDPTTLGTPEQAIE